MEKISDTKAEASRGFKSGESRDGKQDRNISIRLPSSLLDDIDRMSKANGQGRSELIRDIISGALTMSMGDFNEEEILRLQQAFGAFCQWINDPLESLLYTLYKLSITIESAKIQKQITMLMVDNMIGLANLLSRVPRETTLQSSQETALESSQETGEEKEFIQESAKNFFYKAMHDPKKWQNRFPPEEVKAWKKTLDEEKKALDEDTEDEGKG